MKMRRDEKERDRPHDLLHPYKICDSIAKSSHVRKTSHFLSSSWWGNVRTMFERHKPIRFIVTAPFINKLRKSFVFFGGEISSRPASVHTCTCYCRPLRAWCPPRIWDSWRSLQVSRAPFSSFGSLLDFYWSLNWDIKPFHYLLIW